MHSNTFVTDFAEAEITNNHLSENNVGLGDVMPFDVDNNKSNDRQSELVDSSITEKMWTLDYIGLYSHYAAVGFVSGVQGFF